MFFESVRKGRSFLAPEREPSTQNSFFAPLVFSDHAGAGSLYSTRF